MFLFYIVKKDLNRIRPITLLHHIPIHHKGAVELATPVAIF